MATGFSSRGAARVLTGEGLLLGAAGVVLGAPGGVGYAWLIIHALRTWWSGAVGNLDLALHVTPRQPGHRFGRGIPGFRGRRPLGRAAAAPHADAGAARRLAGDGRAAAEAPPPARAWDRHRGAGPGGGLLLLRTAVLQRRPKAPSWARRVAALGFLALVCARIAQRAEARRPRKRFALAAGLARRVARLAPEPAHGRPASRARASSSSWWRRTERTSPAPNTAERRSGAGGFSPLARSDVPIFDRPEHGRRPRGARLSARSARRRIRRVEVFSVPHDRRRRRQLPEHPAAGPAAGPRRAARTGRARRVQLHGGGGEAENPWRLLEREEKPAVPALRSSAASAFAELRGQAAGDETADPGVRRCHAARSGCCTSAWARK